MYERYQGRQKHMSLAQRVFAKKKKIGGAATTALSPDENYLKMKPLS